MSNFKIKAITLLLLTLTSAAVSYSQFPSQSPYDENYAPKSLRGLKDLDVRGQAQIFIPIELLKTEINHSDVKSRVEGMLTKAGIGYLSEKDAELTPDAPVLNVDVIATKMMGPNSFSLAIHVALLRKVMVDDESKLRITATTWLDSEISTNSSDNPRERIFESIDNLLFEFIKAYMIGNSKPAPKISKFFNIGPSIEEPTAAEVRPKDLKWGTQHKGLEMAAWTSPVRPVVFSAIRNASGRTIHYCDYLLGYFENVRLYARHDSDSDWSPIPLKPSPYRAYVGVLLCSRNDSLGPGKEMPPNWSHVAEGAPKIKRKYTFTEYLTDYDFPANWKGKVECKITQTIFGGRHKNAWEGTVESSTFGINLPLESK